MESLIAASSAIQAIQDKTNRQITDKLIWPKVLKTGASCFDVFEKASVGVLTNHYKETERIARDCADFREPVGPGAPIE